MSASDRQVGGEHYRVKKGGVGHWDYCIFVNVPYLEAAATKYITRWRDKNGTQDLEKAIHYTEKRIESYRSGVGVVKGANRNQRLFNMFVADNEIPLAERGAIDTIMHWKTVEQLEGVLVTLKMMIEAEEEAVCSPGPAYVNQG